MVYFNYFNAKNIARARKNIHAFKRRLIMHNISKICYIILDKNQILKKCIINDDRKRSFKKIGFYIRFFQ